MATSADIPAGFLSTAQWKDVLEDILPAQGAWSEEEYLVLTDHRRRLVEFSDGLLEVLPMPTDKHQAILGFLFGVFRQVIEARGGLVRFAPLRLQIRPGKYREPDLLALLAGDDPRRQDRFWAGADLVVEVVSEDQPQRDLVDKRADYAAAGVAEYWIVDPRTATVTVLRLTGDHYEEAGVYSHGSTAQSTLVAELSLDVSATFDAK